MHGMEGNVLAVSVVDNDENMQCQKRLLYHPKQINPFIPNKKED